MRRLTWTALLLALATPLAAQTPMERLDALLAADSVAAAARAADAVLLETALPAAQRAQVGAMFGRFAAVDAAELTADPAPGTTAVLTRLASGAVPDAVEQLEARLRGRNSTGAAGRAITELGFALRGYGPALRATTDDPAMLLLVYEAARDSAGVRALRGSLDLARSRVARRNLPPPLTLAEADLFLGDSAQALVRLLAWEAAWTAMERPVAWGAVQNGWMLGRTWLLLGDLARALRRPADAERAYHRVLPLWDRADAELQPALARARDGLAALDGRAVADAVAPRATLAVTGGGRFRYDAVLWMNGTPEDGARPLARMSFVTTEQVSPREGALEIRQLYDSVILDMPALDRLGAEGLELRRQIQGASGRMTATTTLDLAGRTRARSLDTDAPLPGELRSLLEGPLGFGPLAAAIPLPPGAMTIGASWTDTLRVVIPGAGGAAVTLRATYRLVRIAEAGGRRLAFVTLDAEGVAPQADGSRMEARLSGELVRDALTGESLRLAASLRASVAGMGGTTPVRVLLTALRDPSAPAAVLAAR